MMIRRTSLVGCLVLSFTCVNATALFASDRVSIDIERGPDDAYVVVAAFEVSAPPAMVWQVLTDYEGIGDFVSSIRESTIRQREPGRVLLEQHGVGRAWIVSVAMHVVLDVREHGKRTLAFRDVCGKSFTTYEGQWELAGVEGGTRVTYRLKADPSGRQPAMVAGPAIRGSVKNLLREVRSEILTRAAR